MLETKKVIDEYIENIKRGNDEYLKQIFKCLDIPIRGMVNKYLIPGVEKDDAIQIAQIAVYDGVKNYNSEKNSNPISFLKMCAERRLKDVIKFYNKDKRKVLSMSCSLDAPVKSLENNEKILLKDIISTEESLDDYMEAIELKKFLKEKIYLLMSKREKECFELYYIQGYKYSEISKKLSITNKQVENALQKARNKIKSSEELNRIYFEC